MAADPDDTSALDPDAIAGRSFTRVRKGFEVDEVRAFLVGLASEVRDAERRRDDAERRVAELERRATDPRDLDETQVTQLLGEETARVLETARTAAADIRAKAEQEAASLAERTAAEAAASREAADAYRDETTAAADAYDRELRERVDAEVAEQRAGATAEVEAMTSQAETVLAERTAEAEAAAAAILEEATSEAERIRAELTTYDAETRTAADIYASEVRAGGDQARAEAESAAADRLAASEGEVEAILDAARAEGRAMVEEARSYRERVIADLADRRRIARGQLDQLAATRDALAITLTDVAGRVEASHRAVVDTVVDVRSLGDVATDRAALGGDAGSTATPAADGEGEADDEAEAPEAGADDDGSDEVPAAEPGGEEPDPEASPEPVAAEADEVPADEEGAEPEAPEPESEVDPEPEEEPPAEVEASPEQDEPVDDGGDGDAVPEANDPEPEADRGPASDPVDAMFAQLKAETARTASPAGAGEAEAGLEPEAEAAPVGDADEVDDEVDASTDVDGVGDGAEGDVEGDGGAAPDEDAELLDRRDATTDALERQLARRLKRVLSDEQNEALDRLRRGKGAPDADQVLLSEGEHLGRYHEAALADLIEAERAGAGFFGDAPARAAEVGDVAQEFAAELVRQLRSRLEAAFADGGDEQEVSDRIRACYREWKTQRIAETAAHYVLVAFNRGVAEATEAGASSRWLVDDGGAPCPDCDDNALAGGVPHGDEFPTGDLHPPAHPGCRCLAVPA